MNIKRKDNGKKGIFIAMEDDTQMGEMTYVWVNDDRIIIDHTEVYPNYEGQGTGKRMFMEAVAFARERDIKIIPLCPFAKIMFKRLPETGDVLAN